MKFSVAFPAILRLRCPHCGETPLFAPAARTRAVRGWFDVAPGCPRCRYRFEREPGYFLMATWATVFFPAAFFGIALMLLFMTMTKLGDGAVIAFTALPTALFALAIARHGRVLFLAIDHGFDPLSADDRAAWEKLRREAGSGSAELNN